MWKSGAVQECRRDGETALNSLKCVVYENHFAKSELCGKEKAVGICMCGGNERSEKCQERRKSYLLLKVESHIRTLGEPKQGN